VEDQTACIILKNRQDKRSLMSNIDAQPTRGHGNGGESHVKHEKYTTNGVIIKKNRSGCWLHPDRNCFECDEQIKNCKGDYDKPE
jgi:hypothetical protein